MPVEIVEVDTSDRELWASAVGLFRGVQHDSHDRFLLDPATVAFVARRGERVVGWAWGYRQLRADGDSMLLLYEIDVIEAERRQGTGRLLVEAFLELGRREGHRKMWLVAAEDNREARSLYESAGGQRPPTSDISYWWPLG